MFFINILKNNNWLAKILHLKSLTLTFLTSYFSYKFHIDHMYIYIQIHKIVLFKWSWHWYFEKILRFLSYNTSIVIVVWWILIAYTRWRMSERIYWVCIYIYHISIVMLVLPYERDFSIYLKAWNFWSYNIIITKLLIIFLF